MKKRTRLGRRIFLMCVFAMLGALMLCTKIIMEVLPNIHLLGMLTIVYTLVFRVRALIPIYIYVFLNGLFAGFNVWWIPYLYIWTILWGVVMLLPKNMPTKIGAVVYPLLCALHGLFFGILYAPAQAIMFGLSFKEAVAWVASGIPFDIVHMIGNFAVGLLIIPMYKLLSRLVDREM